MNIQHSTRSDLWYTPESIIARVREVLGPIDLDPASDEFANRTIKAKRILTERDNSLVCTWPAAKTVFLNPPGGKVKNKSKTALYWARLLEYREHCTKFQHGIFLAFSAEALQNTQGKGVSSIMEFPFCVPAKRIPFNDAYGNPGPAPSHSNVIVYVHGAIDKREHFYDVFASLGDVKL